MKKTIAIKTSIITRIIVLVAIVFLCVFPFWQTENRIAVADNGTLQGSNVLDDLSKDTSFSQYNYPIDESNNKLQIINIAESWNNELLIYVYQPNVAKNYRANYISMSTTINNAIDPDIYKLTYCNSNGTLYKYVVDDFVVNDKDEIRYYEIYSIFRPFDESVDDPANNDNTINSVPSKVAKSWKIGTINGNTFIHCVNVQTIDVTAKYVGFVRYENSAEYEYLTWLTGYDYPIDSHFVAFDTDLPIDNLLEAEVFYTQQFAVWSKELLPDGDFSEPEPKEVIVKSEEEVSFTSEGWYNYGNFEWNRIQTVDEFISGEDSERLYEGAIFDVTTYNKISDESREYLNSCKWVLRFAETEYMVNKNATGVVNWNRYIVGNVTILRFKFVTAGVTYNLGVVDNMQTGSSIPSNVSGTEVTLSDEFSEFLTALLIIVAIVILIVLSPIVFKAIKLIFQILFAPFKALFGGKSKSKSYSKKRR